MLKLKAKGKKKRRRFTAKTRRTQKKDITNYDLEFTNNE